MKKLCIWEEQKVNLALNGAAALGLLLGLSFTLISVLLLGLLSYGMWRVWF
jgi:hypothetical protein